MKEQARAWRIAGLGGLEVLHGDFLTQRFVRHAHPGFVVVLIEQGVSGYWYRGANRVVGAGQVAFINPEEVHTGHSLTDGGYSQRSIYLEASRFGGHFFRDSYSDDPLLLGHLRAFHRSFGKDLLEAGLHLERALQRLRYSHLAIPSTRLTPERALIAQVRELLEQELSAELTLEGLAKKVGLSPYHLARAFQREVGLPPHPSPYPACKNLASFRRTSGTDRL